MSDLEFTNFALSIEDLPARARGLDEDATSDVLGGYSRAAYMKKRRAMIMAMRRRRAQQAAAKKRAYMKRKAALAKRKQNPARRARKKQYMAKASFHSRMASRFRRAAASV